MWSKVRVRVRDAEQLKANMIAHQDELADGDSMDISIGVADDAEQASRPSRSCSLTTNRSCFAEPSSSALPPAMQKRKSVEDWRASFVPKPQNAPLYSSPEELFKQLDTQPDGGLPPVKLLRGSWLLARAQVLSHAQHTARRALALKNRQQLEMEQPEAFLTANEVRELERGSRDIIQRAEEDSLRRFSELIKRASSTSTAAGKSAFPTFCTESCLPLRIIVVSHAWQTREHPDPHGEQLMRLARAIRKQHRARRRLASLCDPCLLPWLCVSPIINCVCFSGKKMAGYYPLCNPAADFPAGEFAVFYDFCSLYQKERNEEQQTAFDTALSVMGSWYAHRLTTTVALTDCADTGVLPYHERGWPTFEYSTSVMKMSSYRNWNQLIDAVGHHGVYPCPMTPEDFALRIKLKHFTNGADCEMVSRLYCETVSSVMGGLEVGSYIRLNWGDAEAQHLARVLPLATRMLRLSLMGNRIGCNGAEALAAAISEPDVLPCLEELALRGNLIASKGAFCIAAALRIGAAPSLTKLSLELNSIDSAGRAALRERCRSRGVRVKLELQLSRRMNNTLHSILYAESSM